MSQDSHESRNEAFLIWCEPGGMDNTSDIRAFFRALR
jgi:hypothetical protein